MSTKTFYANPDLEDGFGSTAGNRSNAHRGLDFPMGAGADIPAWEGGVVVTVAYSSIIGWYVVVRLSDGTYAGYCHLRDRWVAVGQTVFVGTSIGTVAGYDDDHGSAWAGPHLHTTHGPYASSVYSGTVWDPWPRIFASVNSSTSIAAGDITPIQEEDMDANQAKQLEEAHRFSMEVYNAFFRGGSSTPKQLAITDILQPGRVTRNATRPSVSENGEISFIQEIADAKTLGLNNQDAIKALDDKLDTILQKLSE